jgi:hypothetical protein
MKNPVTLALVAVVALLAAGCTTVGKAPIGKTPVVTKY